MKVGIFHPALNVCGGAEWVAINIINILKNKGHRVVVLSNERIDQDRIQRLLGHKVNIDTEVVFPFELFPRLDYHNVYTDALRTLFLKSECDVLIDTYSNAILPGVNLTYVHFPLSGRVQAINHARAQTKRKFAAKLKGSYYTPYRFYERRKGKDGKRLIFANSRYTMDAIRNIIGATSVILHPPIPKTFFADYNDFHDREDIVVSVARISREKLLTTIPHVARLTNKKIRFLIVGIRQSSHVLNQILELIKKNKVSDRVRVMTDVSREKLQDILRTSKVFFHPTHGEHFGVSIVEAMASGCTPVVHNSGGPVEFVPERFRFDTTEEAAGKIEKAVFEWSPKHPKQFIHIAQSFSEDNFSAKFSKIFDSYIDNHVAHRRAKDTLNKP